MDQGVYDDGWMGEHVRTALPAGGAGTLVVRADVLPVAEQALEVRISGEVLWVDRVAPGRLDLRIPVHASARNRDVELRWTATRKINEADPRLAAGRLELLAIAYGEAPREVRLPADLRSAAVEHHGFHGDGWVDRMSSIVLRGGDADELVVRATVHLPEQRLAVAVDGATLLTSDVDPGLVDVRAPLPASEQPRRIELTWAAAAPLAPRDPREVAARVTFIGLGVAEPPGALARIPADLADPRIRYAGISDDGWLAQEASVVLSDAGGGDLVVRAEVLPADGQRLDVLVDGDLCASRPAPPGPFELRATVPAQRASRTITLRWAGVARVSPDDQRVVAARVTYLGFLTANPPSAFAAFPRDLVRPGVVCDGIHHDGWLEPSSRVVLAGGAPAHLFIRAFVHVDAQQLDVAVDSVRVAACAAPPGDLDLHVPIPAAAGSRDVRLYWTGTAPVGPGDERQAAALLRFIGIA